MDTAISVDETELKENAAFVDVLLQAPEIPNEPASPSHQPTPPADAVAAGPYTPRPARVRTSSETALAVPPSSSGVSMTPMSIGGSEATALTAPAKRARLGPVVPTQEGTNSASEGEQITMVIQLKSGLWRAEIILDGKKYRGPSREAVEEADNDRIRMDQARGTNTLQDLLQEWDMTSQLLPKGVYYNKSKKAFIATIHQQVSFAEAENLNSPPLARSTTVKYEGPSRHTVEEAMQDRVLLEAAQTPEDLQLLLSRLRRPKQEKRRAPDTERIPTGVHFRKDGLYMAQISLHRKNYRGPPRSTLEEAVADRQRLSRAKEEGRVEEVWTRMKEEYAQIQQLRRLTSTPPTGLLLRGPGRPRGSVTRLAHVPLPDLAALTAGSEPPSYIAGIVPPTSDHHEEAVVPSRTDTVVKLDVSHFECATDEYENNDASRSVDNSNVPPSPQ